MESREHSSRSGNLDPAGQTEQQDEIAHQAQIRRELLAPPQRETVMRAGRGVGSQRPARTYVTGRWTKRLRYVAIAISGAAVLFTLVRFPLLPQTIPTHFSALGKPDAWGPRASVLILSALAIAMTAGMAWLSHHPRTYNYLHEITETNAQQQYRRGEQMMVGITLGIALTFAGILITTATAQSVNVIFLALTGGVAILGSLVWGLARPKAMSS